MANSRQRRLGESLGTPVVRSLLVTPIYTASSLTGGGQRTLHLYRALARLGSVDVVLVSEPVCRVLEQDLAPFAAEMPGAGQIVVHRSTEQFLLSPAPGARPIERLRHQATRALHAMRPRSHFYSPSPSALMGFEALLSAGAYDVIVGRYLQATALSGALSQARTPVIVDLDDLDEVVLRSRLASPTTSRIRRWALRWQIRQLTPLVARLRAEAQHLFTATAADRATIGERGSSVLPNVPFLRAGQFAAPAPAANSRTLLFIGTYAHRVNREGVRHFVAHCWPAIRRRDADARFRIVGSGGWEQARSEFAHIEGIDVVGAVDDLYQEYASAALCVAPLFEGSGTKIKILEAMMYGRAVVAAAYSVRGLEELLDGGVFTAASDAEMIDTCVELLASPERRASAAARGRELVAERYSEDSIFRVVERALVDCGVLASRP
ncbi:MAG TPA: glycosyltransferase [Burkholderiaceae bacterium]|nr:glycosyltransferase [Burkholderiaceae bacterium]